jgi:hypothetical protein
MRSAISSSPSKVAVGYSRRAWTITSFDVDIRSEALRLASQAPAGAADAAVLLASANVLLAGDLYGFYRHYGQ